MKIGRFLVVYALVFSLGITMFSSVVAGEPPQQQVYPPDEEYPVADFTWSPDPGFDNEPVYFQDKSYGGEGASIVNRSWDFGDGTYSYQRHPTHIYTVAGSYNVNLTVRNSRGLYDSCTKVVNINHTNQPPVANAGGSYNQSINKIVYFDGSNSFDPDGYIVTYEWSFGDGQNGTGMQVEHIYNTEGNYTATLKVTDDNGATDIDTALVKISAGISINSIIVSNYLLQQVLQKVTQMLKQRFSNSLIVQNLENKLEVLSSLETTETASTQIENEVFTEQTVNTADSSSSSSSSVIDSTASNFESTSSPSTTDSSSQDTVVDSNSSPSSSPSVENESSSDTTDSNTEKGVIDLSSPSRT